MRIAAIYTPPCFAARGRLIEHFRRRGRAMFPAALGRALKATRGMRMHFLAAPTAASMTKKATTPAGDRLGFLRRRVSAVRPEAERRRYHRRHKIFADDAD